jgi:hypothetical protein
MPVAPPSPPADLRQSGIPTTEGGNVWCMPTTHHHDVERGMTPELIGIVLAVLVLAALVGMLVLAGA